jgi:hypothetical protein
MLGPMQRHLATVAVGSTMALALVLAGPRLARAEEPPAAPWAPQEFVDTQPRPEEIVYERQWYGMPIVISDSLALGALTCALAVERSQPDLARGLALAGLGAYLVAGPIVHFTEGRVGIGFASLGMRAGAPGVGLVAGMLIGAIAFSKSCSGDDCALAGLAVGGVVGLVGGGLTAAIVDAAAMARKSVPVSRQAMVVLPAYNPVTGHTGLVLRGIW